MFRAGPAVHAEPLYVSKFVLVSGEPNADQALKAVFSVGPPDAPF